MPLPHPDLDASHFTYGDRTSLLIAASMMSMPLWLDYVKVVSEVAAIFAPILGCIYLSLQIGFKLWDRAKSED